MRVGISCACLVLLLSPAAHASGDPAVIYLMAGGALVQVVLGVFMLTARAFRPARLPALAAYALYLVVLWPWVWESKPSETLPGIGLIVLPVVIVGTLLWLLITAHRRSDVPV